MFKRCSKNLWRFRLETCDLKNFNVKFKTMKNCCRSGPKNKKVFNLPRKFAKLLCILGPIKGFTMRSSCAPYKNCKK